MVQEQLLLLCGSKILVVFFDFETFLSPHSSYDFSSKMLAFVVNICSFCLQSWTLIKPGF
jgi:hypothetical protein